ncbi:unnamed protein product [Urochloa humidicola]
MTTSPGDRLRFRRLMTGVFFDAARLRRMLLRDRWAAASSYALRFLNLNDCSSEAATYTPSLHPRHYRPRWRPHPHPRRRLEVPATLRFPPRAAQLPRSPSGPAFLSLRPHQGLKIISQHQAQGSG